MECYRTITIVLALSLVKDISAYVLNKEICLKLQYNLEQDFENSLERYHFCQALSQTLDGVEQVIYKMQIKDHMADAWTQLVKKRGVEFALFKLDSAKQNGMVTEEAASRWQDEIKSRAGKSYLEAEAPSISPPLLQSSTKQHGQDKDLMSGESSWVYWLLIGGSVTYLLLGLSLMVVHHIRQRKQDEIECQVFLIN
uniref:Uncharacterized protein n=1 Tax=Rhodnius prolixus TaxID=13249 RepID=T1HZN8_RHOPR